MGLSDLQTELKQRLMQKHIDGRAPAWFVSVMFFVFRLKQH